MEAFRSPVAGSTIATYVAADGRLRAIDGRKLVEAAVAFSRELRAAGLAIDLGAVVDFARGLGLVDLGEREQVQAAGAAVFVRSREQRDVYDRVFRRFWRGGQLRSEAAIEPPTALVDERDPEPAPPERERGPRERDRREGGAMASGEHEERATAPGEEFEGVAIAADAYSRETLDRHRQFDRMTAAELREAERFVDLLAPHLERRRTRRRELDPRGRHVAQRAMFRRNVATGGDAVHWLWQRTARRPRSLVVLCDVSGSMERHSRLLLRFTQALAGPAVRTESFVFGTRLTRVTRLLRDRDRNRALARVAEATTDWSGGTRIGDCLREFNQRWARRVMRSSAVVVIVSDGWDLGDRTVMADEMARLQRSCHRLIWLNPLASAAGYQPLAGGMAAALPYLDDFVPAGTLASLERLALLLSDTGRRRGRSRGMQPAMLEEAHR